jgi:hypothetical protein
MNKFTRDFLGVLGAFAVKTRSDSMSHREDAKSAKGMRMNQFAHLLGVLGAFAVRIGDDPTVSKGQRRFGTTRMGARRSCRNRPRPPVAMSGYRASAVATGLPFGKWPGPDRLFSGDRSGREALVSTRRQHNDVVGDEVFT